LSEQRHASLAPYENVTLSVKLEKDNISQRHHRRTDLRPQATCTNKKRKLCYHKDYRAMRVTAQSNNTHMVCC